MVLQGFLIFISSNCNNFQKISIKVLTLCPTYAIINLTIGKNNQLIQRKEVIKMRVHESEYNKQRKQYELEEQKRQNEINKKTN